MSGCGLSGCGLRSCIPRTISEEVICQLLSFLKCEHGGVVVVCGSEGSVVVRVVWW